MTSKHPFELENQFSELVDDLWEVERILTQEWYHLELIWVVYR